MGQTCLIVVALALFDPEGRLLVAQRPENKSLAGLWELPGGKLEAGESPEAALVREIDEELGLQLAQDALQPLTFASHAYAHFHLLMPVYAASHQGGPIHPKEGQAIQWVDADGLRALAMPPADVPLIAPLVAHMRHIIDRLGCHHIGAPAPEGQIC